MIHYQVTMRHNEKSFQALARIQYDLFCKKNQVVRTIISFAAFIVGVLNYSKWWGALLLVYGAYMSSSKYAQADHTARKMVKGIRNAGLEYPTSRYIFREGSVQVMAMPENEQLVDLRYADIYGLGEDKDYYYLFRDQYGGYVVPKEELGKQKEEFRTFMEEKSGKFFSTGRKAPITRMLERIKAKRR